MSKKESSDVNFTAIGVAVSIGLVLAVFIFAGVWGMYRFLQARNQSVDVRRSLVAPPPAAPPQPRLQVDPRLDWRDYRQSQLDLLNGYGWASRDEQKARIPISRAMELLVEKEK
jgi:hypothetical protein